MFSKRPKTSKVPCIEQQTTISGLVPKHQNMMVETMVIIGRTIAFVEEAIPIGLESGNSGDWRFCTVNSFRVFEAWRSVSDACGR